MKTILLITLTATFSLDALSSYRQQEIIQQKEETARLQAEQQRNEFIKQQQQKAINPKQKTEQERISSNAIIKSIYYYENMQLDQQQQQLVIQEEAHEAKMERIAKYKNIIQSEYMLGNYEEEKQYIRAKGQNISLLIDAENKGINTGLAFRENESNLELSPMDYITPANMGGFLNNLTELADKFKVRMNKVQSMNTQLVQITNLDMSERLESIESALQSELERSLID